MKTTRTLLGALALGAALSAAAADTVVKLPAPALNDVTLKQALRQRKTSRTFSDRALSVQEISNLLWAAAGVNRPDGKFVIPGARARYAISLYVAKADGIWKFDSKANTLTKVSALDLRAESDGRKMGADAPVVVVMVADEKVFGKSVRGADYTAIEAGAIMQDLYLYCAAAGLNTVVCGSFKDEPWRKALDLPAEQRVILTQVVGYPVK